MANTFKMKPRTSRTGLFFNACSTPSPYKFKSCRKEMTTKSGPSNLTRHLKTQHAKCTESECSASAPQTQATLGAISRFRPNQVISTYFQRPMPLIAAEKTHRYNARKYNSCSVTNGKAARFLFCDDQSCGSRCCSSD